jgi:glycine/D-amino acid oxidase-like deaminating enzyme/nitrite reductase/ring-hydroxylating ferredoxin subunit
MTDREQVDRPIWEWPSEGNGDVHTDALTENLDIDVVVTGGGITGLTAALLLASDKRRVALLEARHLGAGTTGSTSAHVSAVPDVGYQAVLRTAGADGGKEYVSRCAAALEFMQHLVEAEQVECGWARVPAYQFSERDEDLDFLRAEQEAAAQLGQMSQLVSDVPLPWHVAGALEFPQQALFEPLAYLAGLKRIAAARGVAVHEHTPVLGWEEARNGVVVQTPHASVRAAALVLATHTPLGFNPVQAELTPMQSYILAVRSSQPFPQALFWDLDDPYHYLRPVQVGGRSMVLVGGADHKTGRHVPDRYADLIAYAYDRLAGSTVERWWSAQFFEPADGLPYIGRAPRAARVYMASGFSGVGLVQGTMAAMELAATVRGEAREDVPWRATRLTVSAAPRLVVDGLDTAACWVGDRLTPVDVGALEAVPTGEGRIVRVDGHRRAAFRDDDGRVHVFSPVCPHLGCLVRWNGSARSWDCPCHGSRFAPTGEVLEGPAMSGLTRVGASAPYAGAPTETPAEDAIRLDTNKG